MGRVMKVEVSLVFCPSVVRAPSGLAARWSESGLLSVISYRVPTCAELARREDREYEPASVLLKRIKAERVKAIPEKSKRAKPVKPRAR